MSAAEVEWEPGDPLIVDQGCGTVPGIVWSPDERAAARAEDDTPPPWWRPDDTGPTLGWNHHCPVCNVQWRGDDPCWMCGGEQLP